MAEEERSRPIGDPCEERVRDGLRVRRKREGELGADVSTAALVVAGRLVTLPVSAYAETVRHRFGLSTRSWGLWLRDVAVATAISAVLTALALMFVLWLVRRAPRTWWAWAAGAAAAFGVVGSFLYPVVIEPAFNSFASLLMPLLFWMAR